MKGPKMAPDDPGGSSQAGSGGQSPKPGDAAPDYAKQWQQDKLISDIEKELGALGQLPQDLVTFWGFAANSDREGYARLYLNLQFNEYIEFPTADMVLSKDMGGQDRPFSGIVVWLKRSATVQHVTLEALDLQRNFLQSNLQSPMGGMGGGSGAGFGGGGGSIVCGGGGSIVCGGGGSIVCGGGGSIVCGGGGSIVCGGGGSIVCGGGGSIVCGGGGSIVCGGGGSIVCGGGGSIVCGGGGSLACGQQQG